MADGIVPVAAGVGGALDEDLARLVRPQERAVAEDRQLDARKAAADGREAARVDLRRDAGPPHADSDRGLGQAVAGRHHVLEPEDALELAQRARPHRLGGVERHAEARQVVAGGGGVAQAEPVGEIGRRREGAAVLRDLRQPGAHARQARRQQDQAGAEIERDHRHQDEAHVVVHREPAHEDVAGRDLHAGDHLLDVGEDVGVGDLHALGLSGAAGGVLDVGDGVRVGRRQGGRARACALAPGAGGIASMSSTTTSAGKAVATPGAEVTTTPAPQRRAIVASRPAPEPGNTGTAMAPARSTP